MAAFPVSVPPKECLSVCGGPDHAEAWQLSYELYLDYINTDHSDAVAAFSRIVATCASIVQNALTLDDLLDSYAKMGTRIEMMK